jgi:hypothetical protein
MGYFAAGDNGKAMLAKFGPMKHPAVYGFIVGIIALPMLVFGLSWCGLLFIHALPPGDVYSWWIRSVYSGEIPIILSHVALFGAILCATTFLALSNWQRGDYLEARRHCINKGILMTFISGAVFIFEGRPVAQSFVILSDTPASFIPPGMWEWHCWILFSFLLVHSPFCWSLLLVWVGTRLPKIGRTQN